MPFSKVKLQYLFYLLIITDCGEYCRTGCSTNGAGKCDNCQDGYYLADDDTCAGGLLRTFII